VSSWRGDQAQAAALLVGLEALFLVFRRDPGHVGQDPELQEVRGLRMRAVEFAVQHAASRAHALHVARADRGTRAGGIAVRQLAFQHVADDLHVAVAVRAEARARHHAVLVDHPQRAELHVPGVE
jgi:hypothetical protein